MQARTGQVSTAREIVFNPFELARHRRHRLDVNGAFGRAPIGDRAVERDHHRMGYAHDRALRR